MSDGIHLLEEGDPGPEIIVRTDVIVDDRPLPAQLLFVPPELTANVGCVHIHFADLPFTVGFDIPFDTIAQWVDDVRAARLQGR